MSDTILPGDHAPLTLEGGADYHDTTMPAPQIHGVGISFHMDDSPDGITNELYDSLRQRWETDATGPDDKLWIDADPDFVSGDEYVWVFFRSDRQAVRTDSNGNRIEYDTYHLKLRRVNRNSDGESILSKPPASCHVRVDPQKEGLKSTNGNDIRLQYGPGSQIRLQTTFPDSGEAAITRAISALQAVLSPQPQSSATTADINPESKRLWKLETYYRINNDVKHTTIRTVEQSEELIDVTGKANIHHEKERQTNGWVTHKTTSNRWGLLGIDETDYDRALKIYHAPGWTDKPTSDPAHHPKFEAYYAGTEGANPHLDEWDTVLNRLRDLLIVHCDYAGVDSSDLIKDDYFQPTLQPQHTTEVPEGRKDDLRAYYDRFETPLLKEALNDTGAIYDILSYLLDEKGHGATYDELTTATGYSLSNIQTLVSKLKDIGILVTTGYPALIHFYSDRLRKTVQNAIKNHLAPYFDEETLGRRRCGRQDRARERRQARENNTAPGTPTSQDTTDTDTDNTDDTTSNRNQFVYLKDWHGTPKQMYEQVISNTHERDETDIRVRILDPDD